MGKGWGKEGGCGRGGGGIVILSRCEYFFLENIKMCCNIQVIKYPLILPMIFQNIIAQTSCPPGGDFRVQEARYTTRGNLNHPGIFI